MNHKPFINNLFDYIKNDELIICSWVCSIWRKIAKIKATDKIREINRYKYNINNNYIAYPFELSYKIDPIMLLIIKNSSNLDIEIYPYYNSIISINYRSMARSVDNLLKLKRKYRLLGIDYIHYNRHNFENLGYMRVKHAVDIKHTRVWEIKKNTFTSIHNIYPDENMCNYTNVSNIIYYGNYKFILKQPLHINYMNIKVLQEGTKNNYIRYDNGYTYIYKSKQCQIFGPDNMDNQLIFTGKYNFKKKYGMGIYHPYGITVEMYNMKPHGKDNFGRLWIRGKLKN